MIPEFSLLFTALKNDIQTKGNVFNCLLLPQYDQCCVPV